jgi:undecaprenyl-diphosphatase
MRPERKILVALLIVAGALWVFNRIQDQFSRTGGIDRAILLSFRAASDPTDPIGPKWIEEFARDITALGSVTILFPVITATVVYLFLTRRKAGAWTMMAATGGGIGVSSLIKALVARPRPDVLMHSVYVSSFSFPSGHAMMAAVTYLTLGALTAREFQRPLLKAYVMVLAVIVTILVGLSRVYLGVHWPSDVLGGWSLGAAWALLCWNAAEWFDKHQSH